MFVEINLIIGLQKDDWKNTVDKKGVTVHSCPILSSKKNEIYSHTWVHLVLNVWNLYFVIFRAFLPQELVRSKKASWV